MREDLCSMGLSSIMEMLMVVVSTTFLELAALAVKSRWNCVVLCLVHAFMEVVHLRVMLWPPSQHQSPSLDAASSSQLTLIYDYINLSKSKNLWCIDERKTG